MDGLAVKGDGAGRDATVLAEDDGYGSGLCFRVALPKELCAKGSQLLGQHLILANMGTIE
nr:hypothetical protein OG781_37805 [Streptomyces sp. NBC_00830]